MASKIIDLTAVRQARSEDGRLATTLIGPALRLISEGLLAAAADPSARKQIYYARQLLRLMLEKLERFGPDEESARK